MNLSGFTVYISGTQTVYVKTWGCCHNSSDSEYMAGQLAAEGYTITGNTDTLLIMFELVSGISAANATIDMGIFPIKIFLY